MATITHKSLKLRLVSTTLWILKPSSDLRNLYGDRTGEADAEAETGVESSAETG